MDSFLLLQIKARARNVLHAAPRLDAEIGRGMLMPEDEVIKSIKGDGDTTVADLALQGYAIALHAAENERIKAEWGD